MAVSEKTSVNAGEERGDIIDPENGTELARQLNQDRLLAQCLGGPFPEGQALTPGQRVLDLACGPGGWALQVAHAYPKVEVIGVDRASAVVEYARALAFSQGLDNAHFQMADVRSMLPFAAQSFDLVNGRFLLSAICRNGWPSLLAECRRVLRPGGVLQLTEGKLVLTTSEPIGAFERLLASALYEAGHGFLETSLGIAKRLPRLLERAGFEQIATHARVLDGRAGPVERALFENNAALLTLLEQFLLQSGLTTPEELEVLRQRVFIELYQGKHSLHWPLLTVWGQAGGQFHCLFSSEKYDVL